MSLFKSRILGVAMFFSMMPLSFAAQDSGCGLGSMIIQKNAIISQVFSMTTNASFSSQLFGITSGTSNCSANGLVYQEKEAEVYAESHFPALQVEMAQGRGENLRAFAVLLGCNAESLDHFGELTKKNFEVIFPSDQVTPSSLLTGVKGVLRGDSYFRSACSIASA